MRTFCVRIIALIVAICPLAALCDDLTKPTLYIVGDSTVKNGADRGWGNPIIALFDTDRINVENHAVGGRSSRSFQVEGKWDQILKVARPGDFVIIQMGHNDGGQPEDPRGRASLPGLGEETKEIEDPTTKKHEVVHTYGWYMRKYVTDAKAKGMTPIICSPVPHVPRATVETGAVENSRYVGWSQEVAEKENVPFINLNKIIMSHYVGMTPEQIKEKYFTAADNTHTNPDGAKLNASCVVEGIRSLKDAQLAKYLK